MKYTQQQAYQLARRAGATDKEARFLAAVMVPESGGNPKAVNKSSGATGLWQIHPGGSQYLDPLKNAQTAIYKLRTQGKKAWEAYTRGLVGDFTPGGAPQGGTGAPVPATGAPAGPTLAQRSTFARLITDPRVNRDPMRVLAALRDVQKRPELAPAPAPADTVPDPSGTHGITYSGQALTHDTDGLPGYPAIDLFAKPGTAFLAPEDGRVVRLSGRGGTSGNVYGLSVYFEGNSGKKYFITHLGTTAGIGPRRKGQPLGTVSKWKSGSPHAHVGVRG